MITPGLAVVLSPQCGKLVSGGPTAETSDLHGLFCIRTARHRMRVENYPSSTTSNSPGRRGLCPNGTRNFLKSVLKSADRSRRLAQN
jgi:hypothetical protein